MFSEDLTKLVLGLRETKKLPIKKSIVRFRIIEAGLIDEITIVEAPLPPAEVRGAIRQLEAVTGPGGKTRRSARIQISEELDPIWRHFVACKEMMHILDTEEFRTFKADQVTHVIDNLNNFGFDVEKMYERPVDEVADRFAILSALLVLAPLNDLMTELRYKITGGKLAIYEAIDILRIPRNFSGLVLTSHFDELAEVILT